MKGTNLWITILVLLLAAMITFAVVGKNKGLIGGEKATKVTVEVASKKDLVQTVTANGKIYPEIEVKISSDVSGEITNLYVEDGQAIKQGQLLATIKPDSYTSAYDQVEANKNSALANLESTKARKKQAEANLNNAQSIVDKYRKLYEDGNASLLELENYEKLKLLITAEAEIEASDQSIKSLEYTVLAAEATLKQANSNLNKTSIFSPITGIVSGLNVEQGEKVVGTLQMTGTEMMRIADFSDMEIRVNVSETDIIRVHRTDTAIIEVDAFIDDKFKGLVTSIANSSKGLSGLGLSTSQSTNFEVKIRILKSSYEKFLEEYDLPFRPGMSATADIQTKRKIDVLSVPIQSVASRDINADSVGADEDLREFVFIIGDDDLVTQKEVKTGIQNDAFIEILEGLKGGEKIITAPYNAISKDLESGDPVETVSKKELYNKK